MKKTIGILLLAVVLLLAGCNKPGYEKTPETEAAIEAYVRAVKDFEAQTEGKLSITIRTSDTVVRKADVTQRYEYEYTVKNGNDEHFDYRCYDEKDQLINHFKTVDVGGVGKVVDQISGEENDSYKTYLSHTKNPISTLKLFRMDAGYKLQESAVASIKMEQLDGSSAQQIIVEFHPNKLTGTVIRNENGLNRTVTSHKRIYTIESGKLVKIEIYDRENVQYKGETGTMDTDTIVEVKQ